MGHVVQTPEIARFFPTDRQEEPMINPACDMSEYFWLRYLCGVLAGDRTLTNQELMVKTPEHPIVATAITKVTDERPTSVVLTSENGALDGAILHPDRYTPLRTLYDRATILYGNSVCGRKLDDMRSKARLTVPNTDQPLLDLFIALCTRLELPIGERFAYNVRNYSRFMEQQSKLLAHRKAK